MMTIEQLDTIAPPIRTASYSPILHRDLAEAVLDLAHKQGFKNRNANYDIARDGNIMRGIFAFEGDDPEMDMQVGILNSYDKSKTVTIGLGSQVFICQNGMVSADYILKRKHTGSVVLDVLNMIDESLKKLYDEYRRNIEVKEILTKVEITKVEYSQLIGKMFLNDGIITSTQLNIVKREFEGSKLFPEPTAWSMYNHVNQALKSGHPADYISQHIGLHQFMVGEFI